MLFQEGLYESEDVPEGLETVAGMFPPVLAMQSPTPPDIYTRAMETKLISADVEQLIPLVLARGGYEKRQLEGGKGGLCLRLRCINKSNIRPQMTIL